MSEISGGEIKKIEVGDKNREMEDLSSETISMIQGGIPEELGSDHLEEQGSEVSDIPRDQNTNSKAEDIKCKHSSSLSPDAIRRIQGIDEG